MKYVILILCLVSTVAMAQNQTRNTYYTLAQRRAMHEQSCRDNAPPLWDKNRDAWIASCKSETPTE